MNLNDQERNITYLSFQRLSGRLILQPVLKVSVSDAFVYGSSMSIGPGLMWWEPRPQTAPPSAQVWMDLILRKVDLYVNKEILSSRHSSRGPSLCGRLAPWGSPTRNSTRLRGDTGCLEWMPPPRSGLHRYIASGLEQRVNQQLRSGLTF